MPIQEGEISLENLKFRAWDKFDKAMLDVHGINYDAEGIWTKEIFDDEDTGDFIYFCDIELLQSTGLKDKNDTEIFEGDIVKFNNSKGLVEFGRYIDDEYINYGLDGWLVSKEYNGIRIDTPLTEYVLNPYFSIEIIGNKFENIDLLEEE